MALVETWLNCELTEPVKVQYLKGNVFSLDSLGNRIGVNVYKNGEPATLSGSVDGYCVLASGATVPVVGVRVNNTVYIDLIQDCYAVPGPISIAIKLTDGDTITTLACIVANVYQSRTDQMITPGQSIIDDWTEQITTVLQQCVDATAGTVKYSEVQSLTDSQKAQARTNIGAVGESIRDDLVIVKGVEAGENFILPAFSFGYWDSTSGNMQNISASLGHTNKFIVSGKEKLNVVSQFSTPVIFLFWDADGTYIGYTNAGVGVESNVPENACYCALDYYVSEDVSSITLHGETKVQIEAEKADAVISKTNLFNGAVHSGIHSTTNGQFYGTATANDSYFYSDLIPVDGITSLYILGDFKHTRTVYITYIDELQKVIGSTYGNFLILSSSDFPTGTKYIVVTTTLTEKDTLMVYTGIPDRYIPYDGYKVDSYNNAQRKYRRIDHGIVTDKYPPSSGNPVYPLTNASNIVCSYLIDLTGISKLSYVCLFGYYNLQYVNASGIIMSGDINISPNTKGTLTVPSGAVACIYYTGVVNDPANKFTLVAGEEIPDRVYGFDEIEIEGLNTGTDFLYGKKIVFDGDSITEGAGITDVSVGIGQNNNKGWGYWVQQHHPGANVYGFGQSGWTVGKIDGRSDSLLNHISQYPQDVDLFVLSGGYNDQSLQMAMGSIVEVTDGSDSYFNATFDQYTFCGALEYWFQQLRSAYPYAQIVYLITPKRVYASDPTFALDTKGAQVKGVLYSTGEERIELFWEKIREVCDKWAIKYLDFSKTSGVVGTGEITDPGLTIGTRYFSVDDGVPDFTHPNTNYYKNLLVPQIENLMRSVIY